MFLVLFCSRCTAYIVRYNAKTFTKVVHKVKNVSPYQDIFNKNTETEYTSFGTYICLLSHIVAFDIKTLVVPWHHVVACLFNQHPSGLHRLRSIYHQGAPWFLKTGKSPTVPGTDCTEDARRCPNGIAHAARLVQLHETTFQHHTEHQKPMIGCNKIGARTVCANVLYFLDGLRSLHY